MSNSEIYQAETPIATDDGISKVGDPVKLDPKTAARLLARGEVSVVEDDSDGLSPEPEPEPEPEPPTEPEKPKTKPKSKGGKKK